MVDTISMKKFEKGHAALAVVTFFIAV
jgi:hypothetical protein